VTWEIKMEDREIRAALERHWAASDENDFAIEHEIYREEAGLVRVTCPEPIVRCSTTRNRVNAFRSIMSSWLR